MAEVLEVYATKNEASGYHGIYYKIGDNRVLVHRGYQVLSFKNAGTINDTLELITNQAVIQNLTTDHNIVIQQAIQNNVTEGLSNGAELKLALFNALLDENSDTGNTPYVADYIAVTPPQGYYPVQFFPPVLSDGDQ